MTRLGRLTLALTLAAILSPVLAAELPVTIEHDDLTFELHTRRGLAHVTTRRRIPATSIPATPTAGTDD